MSPKRIASAKGSSGSNVTPALELHIASQPDDQTCGPTCLQALYRYYGDPIELEDLIDEVPMLDDGGTLAVELGCHALQRGYRATIATYNLVVFDPTWLTDPAIDLVDKLQQQARAKGGAKLHRAAASYRLFLQLGGKVIFEDRVRGMLERQLEAGHPVLTGLSATYLYQSVRERAEDDAPDDVRGTSAGHFVVLTGYDSFHDTVRIADPYRANPVAAEQFYDVPMERLIGAIFLGVLTYDANLLFIEPPRDRQS